MKLTVQPKVSSDPTIRIESVLEADELVSRSFKAETASGSPLFVEVKNYTSNYSIAALEKKSIKHFDANIAIMVKDNPLDGWKDGVKPHLHYEWMGEGFVNPATGAVRTNLVANRIEAVIRVCRDKLKVPPLSLVSPAFNCEQDITFKIVDDLIQPLTAKVN